MPSRSAGRGGAAGRLRRPRVSPGRVRITGNAPDAEEVAQDAFWSASRKSALFRGDAAFGSWLYRITANGAYQKLRGRRAHLSLDGLAPVLDEEGQTVEPGPEWSARATDPALQAALRLALGAAVDALPELYRTPLVLHDVKGFSNAEIADALRVTLPTVKSRVHRARRSLRRRLAGYVDGGEATAVAGSEAVSSPHPETGAARGDSSPALRASNSPAPVEHLNGDTTREDEDEGTAGTTRG